MACDLPLRATVISRYLVPRAADLPRTFVRQAPALSRSARTDRGHSAVANVLVLVSEALPPEPPLQRDFVDQMNACLPPSIRVFRRVKVGALLMSWELYSKGMTASFHRA